MKKFTTLVTIIVSLSTSAASASELISLKDYLKQELSSSPKMAKEVFKVEGADKGKLAKLAPSAQDTSFTFYYGKSATGGIEKACTVVPQEGKEGLITVGVCYDVNGVVTAVTILTSEEERGKKITEQSFLKQFKGKKVTDAFQLNTDVDGISGATWSSKAVAEALRKTSFAFKTYVGGKK
ncbi:MAG: FMN-binding protein [Bdellovibrionales bacterium]|nr:FMN-binding protein [Bdellovibrionales bacterium]